MPYDIRQNYRGKSGYSVVSPDGTVRGTHPTRTAAIEQQRALYAAEAQRMKKSLEEQLVPEEKELHDALIMIAEKYGKFNQDYTGIWAGYDPPEQNEVASIGVKCANCALYMGDGECEIIALTVAPEGKCRFAVIPDGYVNSDMTQKNFWQGRFTPKS
jgi:hypothetical protein